VPADVLPPDEFALRLYLLGRLSGPDAEAVERFLESDPDVGRTLSALAEEDTFTSALRGLAEGEPVAPEVEATMTALERLVPFDPSRTEALPTSDDSLSFLAPPDRPGDLGQLGGYRVVSVLGAGGMGTVLEAEDPRLGRRVALKVMRPQLATALGTARFLREARAASAVEHDHIVPVFHVGEENGVLFLVMPLLKGESLDARLKREGRLPAAEVARVGREMAAGLAAAHAAGLVHRDIKPANVWLEAPAGRVKLLDFGLARGADATVTQPGTILGTPAYMAPEQARGNPVDPRADLFSLGAVLYRCATGRAPFTGTDTFSVLTSLAVDTPPAPRTLNPDLPPGVAGVIVQLLQKDPTRRPASAVEVARLLGEPPAEVRPRRARWWIAAALATAAALAIAAYTIEFGTKYGTFVVEVAEDHEVAARFKDGSLQLLDADGKVKYTLTAGRMRQDVAPGTYRVQVVGADGLHVETETFEIKKGDQVAVRVTLKPKAVAKVEPKAEPGAEPKKAPPKGAPKKVGPGPKAGEVYRPDDAMQFPGHTVTIRGKVARVRQTNQGKHLFLDFEGPDRLQTLKVLVFADELDAHFERPPQKPVGSFIGRYVGQWIQVTGEVTVRKLDAYVRPASKGPFKFVPALPDDRPLDPAWAEAVGGLAGEAQLKALVEELKKRNPGYDGAVKERLADGAVVGLEFWSPELFDLRPLSVLDQLAHLSVVPRGAAGKLIDLRPLTGLPLTSLSLAGNRRVSDLAPIRELRLEELNLSATDVKDLSPLTGMKTPDGQFTLKRLHLPQPETDLTPIAALPLTDLTGVFNPTQARAALKVFPKLKTIDGKPVAEFDKK
jgi:hypothetical protein